MDLVNVHHATVLCILSTQVSGYVNLRYELVVSKWFQSVKTGAGHLNSYVILQRKCFAFFIGDSTYSQQVVTITTVKSPLV